MAGQVGLLRTGLFLRVIPRTPVFGREYPDCRTSTLWALLRISVQSLAAVTPLFSNENGEGPQGPAAIPCVGTAAFPERPRAVV